RRGVRARPEGDRPGRPRTPQRGRQLLRQRQVHRRSGGTAAVRWWPRVGYQRQGRQHPQPVSLGVAANDQGSGQPAGGLAVSVSGIDGRRERGEGRGETGNGKRETGEGPRLRAGCDPRSRYSESYFSPLPSFVSLLPSPVSRFPFVPLLRIPETPRLPVDLRGGRLMTEPFRSSDEYDEQAHQLYNEGRYEEALSLLREGLLRYPQSVDLHVGVGYAQLAAEQYAWA